MNEIDNIVKEAEYLKDQYDGIHDLNAGLGAIRCIQHTMKNGRKEYRMIQLALLWLRFMRVSAICKKVHPEHEIRKQIKKLQGEIYGSI